MGKQRAVGRIESTCATGVESRIRGKGRRRDMAAKRQRSTVVRHAVKELDDHLENDDSRRSDAW
jgi:hypothetical protein